MSESCLFSQNILQTFLGGFCFDLGVKGLYILGLMRFFHTGNRDPDKVQHLIEIFYLGLFTSCKAEQQGMELQLIGVC